MSDTSYFSQPRILQVFTSLLPRATPHPILNPWPLLARCVSVIPAVLDVEEYAFQWSLALSKDIQRSRRAGFLASQCFEV